MEWICLIMKRRRYFDADVHLPPPPVGTSALTHFELRRGVVWVRVLLHKHGVKDAEGVLDPEDRAVAPGRGKHHEPSPASLRGHEAGSVAVRHGVGSRWGGRLAVAGRRRSVPAALRLRSSISKLHVEVRLLRPVLLLWLLLLAA